MKCLCGIMFKYFKLYLLLIIYFYGENGVHCSSLFSSSQHSHCNYTIDRIDAITNFTNGSLFVSSGQHYWILNPNEKPIHSNARNLEDYLPEFNDIEAVVNIKIRGDKQKRTCVPIKEQIVFYSQDLNKSGIVSKYEDEIWTTSRQLDILEMLNTTKSVNWSQPIDAMAFFDKIAVIFQGDSYTSVKCSDGNWTEVSHTSISSSFNIQGPIDSANFIVTDSPLGDAYLYMFKSHYFYICPIYGSEPCYGPLSIVDDFFKFDKECGLSPTITESSINWMIIVLIIVILLSVLFGFCCYLIVLRSRQITFWVNRRRSKERDNDKDNVQLTYEALNGQIDVPVKPTETKTQTENGNGFDANSEDQSKTPFLKIDEELNHN